jgi:selenocysteine-specific elongation factor
MTERSNLVVGTAGHIDHGKTALVRMLTGINTDRLPAERQRGISIDLGFAALELGSRRLALVDVPGHERFVRNMLAGATGLDLALLVVAADDSVMPQTREHLEILRLLGLPAGVVALTKCDLADASWLDLVEEDVRGLVAGTFLEGAPIVRTSASTGRGADALRDALADACDRAEARPDPGPFRLAIDRAFTLAGHGTVVTGTVASGSVGVGDELEWWPSGRTVRVRGLHQHDRPVERVARGARAAINLAGVRHDEVARGHELAEPGYLAPARLLSVALAPAPDAPRPLRHRGRYRLHLGTAEVAAVLALLGPEQDDPDAPILAQLALASPVVAVGGQPFVLREESPPTTLGGGRVLQPVARRIRRRDAEARARLARLAAPDPSARVASALGFLGLGAWTEASLSRDSGVPVGEVRAEVERLAASGALVERPAGPRRTIRVLAEVAEALDDRLLRALGRLHEARPRQSAITRAHVASELPDLPEGLVAGLIDRLGRLGTIHADARTVARKDFRPRLSQAERKLKDELAAAVREGGLAPPDLDDLAARAGARAAVVPELLALLADEGHLVAVGPGLYLDADAEAEARRRVATLLAGGASMTMAGLRDLLGTTRKYAVPIGEYLDRVGLTRREGDARVLARPEAPA